MDWYKFLNSPLFITLLITFFGIVQVAITIIIKALISKEVAGQLEKFEVEQKEKFEKLEGKVEAFGTDLHNVALDMANLAGSRNVVRDSIKPNWPANGGG